MIVLKKKKSRPAVLLALLVVLHGCLQAEPVAYKTAGEEMTQDFNANLPSEPVTLPWINGKVFPGWYVQFAKEGVAKPDEYRRTYGRSVGNRIYQWRVGADGVNGALGAIPINDSGNIHFGFGLKNATGGILNKFSVGYTGQQWVVTVARPTSITVSYQIGDHGSDLADGTWTDIPKLTFTSPLANADAEDNISGAKKANSVIFDPVAVQSVQWQDGQQLWIRFTVESIPSHSQGLAIDNIRFMAEAK